MKLKKCLLFIFLLLFCTSTYAGEEDNMNVRIDIAIPFNTGIAFDFKVADNFTVGPELAYRLIGVTKTSTSDISRWNESYGARGHWYKNGVHKNGLYVVSSLRLNKITLGNSDNQSAQILDSQKGVSLSAVTGYGWFWGGFNMLLGGGMEFALKETKIEYFDPVDNFSYSDSSKSNRFVIEYTLGWSF